MRPLLEPRLIHDAFGDPGLYLEFHDERRGLGGQRRLAGRSGGVQGAGPQSTTWSGLLSPRNCNRPRRARVT